MTGNISRSWPQNSFFLRSALSRLLCLSMVFSVLLAIVRVIHTGRLEYIFLVWNLFLAWIPWFFSQWLTERTGWMKKKFNFALGFLVWLLFIPNSFYILTDLFHLIDESNDQVVPVWYDLILIFSFAWNGLLLGILSIRQMEKLLKSYFPGMGELVFLYPVMWLNALGVYIGRYMRYNSWDVLTSPVQFAQDIFRILFHPLIYQRAWGMIFCFSVLMTLMYLTLKKLASPISASNQQ
jgi:uncharacterized membrane protein